MLQIRSLKPFAEEYAQYAQTVSRCWPDRPPHTVEEILFDEAKWRINRRYGRFVLTSDAAMVGAGYYLELAGPENEPSCEFQFDLLPEASSLAIEGLPAETGIERHVLRQVRTWGVRKLLTKTRDDQLERLDWLRARGYSYLLRESLSRLRVAVANVQCLPDSLRRAKAAGYEIFSLERLQTLDPDWLQKLHSVWSDIYEDVPGPGHARHVSMEEFSQKLSHPSFTAHSWAVTVRQDSYSSHGVGPYVGVSAHNAFSAMPRLWSIWLTGVRRPHRGKGLATAMKIQCIAWAKERGVHEIEAINEENSPMSDINAGLGFEPIPSWQTWQKPLC